MTKSPPVIELSWRDENYGSVCAVAAFHLVWKYGLEFGIVYWVGFVILFIIGTKLVARTIWLAENWLRVLLGLDENPW